MNPSKKRAFSHLRERYKTVTEWFSLYSCSVTLYGEEGGGGKKMKTITKREETGLNLVMTTRFRHKRIVAAISTREKKIEREKRCVYLSSHRDRSAQLFFLRTFPRAFCTKVSSFPRGVFFLGRRGWENKKKMSEKRKGSRPLSCTRLAALVGWMCERCGRRCHVHRCVTGTGPSVRITGLPKLKGLIAGMTLGFLLTRFLNKKCASYRSYRIPAF